MSLFDDIGNALSSVVGAVGNAVTTSRRYREQHY